MKTITRRSLEDAVDLILTAERQGNDDLANALDQVEGFEAWLDGARTLYSELHEHEEDYRDDGRWMCRCGEALRYVEKDDLYDPDEERDERRGY